MTAEPPGRRGMGSGSEPESARAGAAGEGSGGGGKLKPDTRRPPKPAERGPFLPKNWGGDRGLTPQEGTLRWSLMPHLQRTVFSGYIFKGFWVFFFFGCTIGMWDLSSPTRD